MQPGDWRLQTVGDPDQLPLIQAVAYAVGVLVVYFMLKAGLLEGRK